MAINPGSRYADSPLAQVAVGGRTRTVITAGPQVPQKISYFWHLLMAGDTLQSLAVTSYNDPSQWYRIADANPEVMDWSADLAGLLIRIPVISG